LPALKQPDKSTLEYITPENVVLVMEALKDI